MFAGVLSERDYRALADFRNLLRRFLRFSENEARARGLSPSQHQLLLAIRGHRGSPPTIADMAEALQQRHHSTSELVARAVAAGLVTRTADPADRRRQYLTLTPQGKTLLEALATAHRRELRLLRSELLEALQEL
jgi:DNA-binding MarR family transcriptional regulator